MKTMRLFFPMALVVVSAAGAGAQGGPAKAYVTIEGAMQGPISGGSGARIAAYEFSMAAPREASSGMASGRRIISPRDVATGQASGKRQHQPITITKEWDAASPKLMQALQTKEVLKSVAIELLRRGADGQQETYMTIRLTNALITSIAPHASDAAQRTGRPKFEDITFNYEKIDARDKTGKTMGMDSWRAEK